MDRRQSSSSNAARRQVCNLAGWRYRCTTRPLHHNSRRPPSHHGFSVSFGFLDLDFVGRFVLAMIATSVDCVLFTRGNAIGARNGTQNQAIFGKYAGILAPARMIVARGMLLCHC